MRILHIAEIGARVNGIGTVVDCLYKYQIELGHDVKIASLYQNIAYKHIPILYTPNVSCLCDLFSTWQPDVVLFHSIWSLPYIRMARLILKQGVPYGVMMHGANSVENSKKGYWKKKIANTIWFNTFLRKASGILYLSNNEMENCVSKHLNKHNYIMPNGCEISDVNIEHKKIHEPINIVYLGRLSVYHKGLDYLLDALSILQHRGNKDCHVTFYGNEDDVDIEYVKKRLLDLKDIAHFEGPAYGDVKKRVLSEADIFILTSRYEGMPMGVLEALSYGVPCLLTPGTNMSVEVVKNKAGWETKCNPLAIADDIERAVSDISKDNRQFNSAAYKMSKFYDWKVIAKQSIDILSSIIRINKNE